MPRFGLTRKQIAFGTAGIVVVAAGAAVWMRTQSEPSPRDSAFDGVALTTEEDAPIDLASLEGKPVVVVSWATWCPSCLEALSRAARMQEKYTELGVLAVNRKEEQMIIDDYRAAFALPEGVMYARDNVDRYFANVSGTSMPEVLLYDTDGGLRARWLAPPTEEELSVAIDPLFTSE